MAGQSHSVGQLCAPVRCGAGGAGRLTSWTDAPGGLRLWRSDAPPERADRGGERHARRDRRAADPAENPTPQIARRRAGPAAATGLDRPRPAQRSLRSGTCLLSPARAAEPRARMHAARGDAGGEAGRKGRHCRLRPATLVASLRYLWRPLLARLEPFALDPWQPDIAYWLPAAGIRGLRTVSFFGGLYQKVVVTC